MFLVSNSASREETLHPAGICLIHLNMVTEVTLATLAAWRTSIAAELLRASLAEL